MLICVLNLSIKGVMQQDNSPEHKPFYQSMDKEEKVYVWKNINPIKIL